MKYEIELDCADSVFVQFLRNEAETVWCSLRYIRKIENPKLFELEDLWYNYKLLGAMYLVEEYFTENPQIRDMYPREVDEVDLDWEEYYGK